MDTTNVGILGSTGLVGQRFVKMLDLHPFFRIAALSSSPGSTGKKYGEAVDWMIGGDLPDSVKDTVITPVRPDNWKSLGVKIVFSALPSAVAVETEKNLAREGFCVFSNASAHRMEPDIPVIIPEVNPEHFDLIEVQRQHNGSGGFIVTNSNCSTTGLVMGLKPLIRFGLKSVTVSTYQALSGAGRHGVSSLDILGNVIPYIRTEEEKIERETQKIFGRMNGKGLEFAHLEVNASCCRVPTRDGHLESIVVETDDCPDIETVKEEFRTFKGRPQEMRLPTAPEAPIVLVDDPYRPQPLLDVEAGYPDRAGGMAVTVGRIRRKGKKINFFLLVHNTIRGAAGTCILNAEYAVETGWIQ